MFSLDHGTVLRIVEVALRAPTGDNSQPWLIVWQQNSLSISYDPERAKHELDRNSFALMLSLGVLLENLELVAQNFGLTTEAHLKLATFNNDHQVALVFFKEYKGKTFFTLRQIQNRFTNRENYIKKSVEIGVLHAGHEKNVYVTQGSENLTRYLQLSEFFIWSWPKALFDLLKWVRHTKTEKTQKRDGMHWSEMGINAFDNISIYLLNRFHPLYRFIVSPITLLLVGYKTKIRIQSSSAFICFTAKTYSYEDLIGTGRLALRNWVRLCAEGFAMQPLSLATFPLYWLNTEHWPTDLPMGPKTQFIQSGHEILKKEFGLPSAEKPVWVFRLGYSSTTRQYDECSRLPVQQVFQYHEK